MAVCGSALVPVFAMGV
uniref:Uncharacterized protein n=1 Tax=Anguilla anguilla TaxID=7936 RepID=A0A0E9T1S5_ANGAN